ncbi:hypothetical protein RJT34_08029 [Clitoria ternatea]|uniref:Uncharacterized protein n=1 Tax=Clitoria ternatea TaxID=43366 RepID=A0AAN9K6H7_CLITE
MCANSKHNKPENALDELNMKSAKSVKVMKKILETNEDLMAENKKPRDEKKKPGELKDELKMKSAKSVEVMKKSSETNEDLMAKNNKPTDEKKKPEELKGYKVVKDVISDVKNEIAQHVANLEVSNFTMAPVKYHGLWNQSLPHNCNTTDKPNPGHDSKYEDLSRKYEELAQQVFVLRSVWP